MFQIETVSADFSSASIVVSTIDDCRQFAIALSKQIVAPVTIALKGTLGAGKTQWTRFFAIALGADPAEISSPTFVLVQQYQSKPPIYHIDAYRVGDEDEMLELGIEEYFEMPAVTIIEWADRFPSLMPQDTLWISIEVTGDANLEQRLIRLSAGSLQTSEIISGLTRSASSPQFFDSAPLAPSGESGGG